MSRAEEAIIKTEFKPPFTVLEPKPPTAPLVFNSPHSGRIYPNAFLEASRLDPLALRKSEDAYIEELFAPVVGLGAPLMHANFPRAYLDVNREPYELDPALIAGKLPQYANSQTVRVIGGLGTIARIVTDQEEIYRNPLSLDAALCRIQQLYKPYHAALHQLIANCHRTFGKAVLIDCHSMPSSPNRNWTQPRPDFVLGDRFGTSCDPEFTRIVAQQLRRLGYRTSTNNPYAGGFITEHYGHPAQGHHALQIEVNRALYLDEATFEKTSGFTTLRSNLETLISGLFELVLTLGDIPHHAVK